MAVPSLRILMNFVAQLNKLEEAGINDTANTKGGTDGETSSIETDCNSPVSN